MSSKRPTKKLDRPAVKIKPSPFGTRAGDAEVAISHGDNPQRGIKTNGQV